MTFASASAKLGGVTPGPDDTLLPAFLKKTFWILRLALPKVAVGWMFALLTVDFNRVAVVELGVAAVLVSSLLAIHYLLAPFQVIVGRIADCHPVLGFRRSPYLLGASAVASLAFLALPQTAQAMGQGSTLATVAAVLLFTVFGLCMAVIADSYHSMIAEVTSKKTRPLVISVVWIVMIFSTIAAAVLMNVVRPEYTPEAMQRLYNLTPFIVIGSVLLGIVGVERRMSREELQAAREQARALAPPGNPLSSAVRLLRANEHARRFFIFIGLAIFGIFLQEGVIEIFGAEIFGMGVRQTTRFQQFWGMGILLGMLIVGVVGASLSIPRQRLTTVGCMGAAAAFITLGMIAAFEVEAALLPTLCVLGFFAGVFNVGALSLMMDMTIKGATGMYMGLWGVAQAAGMGFSSIGAGALHTSLIDSGLLAPGFAYWLIFSSEAVFLIAAWRVLNGVNVEQFQAQAQVVVNQPQPRPKSVPVTVATASR